MKSRRSIWVVDDDRAIRWVLEKALAAESFATRLFESGNQALDALEDALQRGEEPEVVISDVRMPGMNGIDMMQKMHCHCPNLPIIIMTAHSDLESAVSSYKKGAFDYLPKPFDIDDATTLVKRGVEHRRQRKKNIPSPPTEPSTEIIGEAPAMQEVFRVIGRLSQSSITVLINGESGTGKELVARALHTHSPRANKPFIALNMAAIPKDLIESELFGHEKGAFSGAGGMRRGRFEQADGGTLFLDEIGDMPADSQTRLLRVLAEGEFYRVGGHTPVRSDLRIIAATHQNLEKQVEQGLFREDLFHRLNVIRVHLPRLRERKEDIPKLASFFLEKAAKEMAVEAKTLSPEAEQLISSLSWPGNVRQLENTCRWLTVMAASCEVLPTDLPTELLPPISNNTPESLHEGTQWQQALRLWVDQELACGRESILERAVPAFERILLEAALTRTGGRKRDAAQLLGWGRNTLTRKLKELAVTED
ncbi:nitrogen regulation protein NR(I) [Candidatus Sororendozoicomonas aggregata]|uniref:nitrogen regulation protein NR(I) n=1 Tax=Candidatus Sororendozoicomonas aggregata TaxID=3073239 RepID=UPI002ED03302